MWTRGGEIQRRANILQVQPHWREESRTEFKQTSCSSFSWTVTAIEIRNDSFSSQTQTFTPDFNLRSGNRILIISSEPQSHQRHQDMKNLQTPVSTQVWVVVTDSSLTVREPEKDLLCSSMKSELQCANRTRTSDYIRSLWPTILSAEEDMSRKYKQSGARTSSWRCECWVLWTCGSVLRLRWTRVRARGPVVMKQTEPTWCSGPWWWSTSLFLSSLLSLSAIRPASFSLWHQNLKGQSVVL